MAASVVSLIVFAGLFSAYVYLARNIARNSYAQDMAQRNARMLHSFTSDVSSASKVVSANSQLLILQFADLSQVTYTYDGVAHTLTRAVTGNAVAINGVHPLPLTFSTPSYASNIFNYYSQTGGSLLPPANTYPPGSASVTMTLDIRQIELSYLSTAGVISSNTYSSFPIVSSRVSLRSKLPLGQ